MKRLSIIILIMSVFIRLQAEEVSFSAHTITTSLTGVSAVDVGDINGDGHADLVTTAMAGDGEVSWWQNNGDESFTKIPVEVPFAGARSVKVIDIDGNGTDDFVVTAATVNKIILWKSSAGGNLTRIAVDTTFLGPHTVDVKDVNNDGHPDILCSGASLDHSQREAAWWENDGEENFTKHLISDQFEKSCFIEGAFINDDEFMDILVCDEEQDDVIWFENDGTHHFPVQHVVDDNYRYIHTAVARDVDQDGDNDIIGCVCYWSDFAWWENTGDGNFSARNHIADLAGAIWVDTMDLDKDGDLDLITASMGENYLNWWENDGSQNFTKHYLSGYCRGGFGFSLKDIDGDSDKDIAAVGYSSNRMIWLENNSPLAMEEPAGIADQFRLEQNFPNPFNPATRICYRLPATTRVELQILNSLGQQIALLVSAIQPAGDYTVSWDAAACASGIYFCRLSAGDQVMVHKMILTK